MTAQKELEERRIKSLKNHYFPEYDILFKIDEVCKCSKPHPDYVLYDKKVGSVVFVEIKELRLKRAREIENYIQDKMPNAHVEIDLSLSDQKIKDEELLGEHETKRGRISKFEIQNNKISGSVAVIKDLKSNFLRPSSKIINDFKSTLKLTLQAVNKKFENCRSCLGSLNPNLKIHSQKNVYLVGVFGTGIVLPEVSPNLVDKDLEQFSNIDQIFGTREFIEGVDGKTHLAGYGVDPDAVMFSIWKSTRTRF